jgi:hypothetical protein
VQKINIIWNNTIPENFNRYDFLDVLCLKISIEKAAPIVPPKRTKLKRALSETLLLFFIASLLS